MRRYDREKLYDEVWDAFAFVVLFDSPTPRPQWVLASFRYLRYRHSLTSKLLCGSVCANYWVGGRMNPRFARFLGPLAMCVLVVSLGGCRRWFGQTAGQIIEDSKHRVVTISYTTGSSGPCEVNFPVSLARVNKHTIAWVAADHDYWIRWEAKSTTTPPSVVAGLNPLVSAPNVIYVPAAVHTPQAYDVTLPTILSEWYFTYAIYDSDPGSSFPAPQPPCKAYDNDRDTGLNVKR
jgi:hypothetical protein